MSVITQSFGKVTILSERVFFESLSLSIGYNGWRLLAVGLSKHQLSITLNVYLKINVY